jgi:hypothetical protein
MITATRLLGLAASCATLLAVGQSMTPASAQERSCKTEVITATGRAKFRPFTKTRELEGRGSAMTDAIATWKREAAARFGERFSEWSDAEDTTRECAPTKSGKIIGSSFIGCTISGRPCATAGAPPGTEPSADIRGRDARARWPAAYAREMARQDYYARLRRHAEDRGWAREEARQRYLANQRDENEGREHAYYRHRYWDYYRYRYWDSYDRYGRWDHFWD